jgi:bifunctional UDP-N-acetylglucosamine pyrophosphorylase/glucosamine-1-phosphate N-acetyltransferase
LNLEVVILAAGQGTRMRSALPKVLHPLAGRPLVKHVIDTAHRLGAQLVHTVIGHGADQLRARLAGEAVRWAEQREQLGTGHAVAQALPAVSPDSLVLILYGDVPLVSEPTLQALVAAASTDTLALLTVTLPDPSGYGRILRDAAGAVVAIVEQKDASSQQLGITEVNTGILAVAASRLADWLPRLSANNAQGEYYLTDIIGMAVRDGVAVVTQQPANAWEVQGVNNRQQLSSLERIYQGEQANRLMAEGATLADPARVDIRGTLTTGRDVVIDVNCVFAGDVSLADNVEIGPNCVITDARIGSGTVIKANSVIESAEIGANCDIGPFARLRPGTRMADGAKVGNFVETKKTVIGPGSKVNHLTYVGDCEIGARANIGAGTITCNYDGVNKFKTIIDDGAFIGSNTSLVAPVRVGKRATVGAGSTITADVGDDQLAVARGRQSNIDGWQRPTKKQ